MLKVHGEYSWIGCCGWSGMLYYAVILWSAYQTEVALKAMLLAK